ncbi:MAG: YitT family protein, partial [Lachnospiraceae bacterium]|nr:YitT family protein [Lachnospiraceae bacterium]
VLAGGVLYAVSIGLIMKAGATTGGMDIIVKWLRVKLPYLKTGVLFFITDAIIISVSGIVFRNLDVALYAGIIAVVNSVVLDFVLYGKDEAKLQYIISDKADTITDRLLKELDIGVTQIEGRGAFSKKEKKVLMCVVKKPVSPRVEDIVKEEDAEAFMVITSATEIFGEGYKSYFADRF